MSQENVRGSEKQLRLAEEILRDPAVRSSFGGGEMVELNADQVIAALVRRRAAREQREAWQLACGVAKRLGGDGWTEWKSAGVRANRPRAEEVRRLQLPRSSLGWPG